MKIEVTEYADGYELKIDDSSLKFKGKSMETAESIGKRITEALHTNRTKLIQKIDKGE